MSDQRKVAGMMRDVDSSVADLQFAVQQTANAIMVQGQIIHSKRLLGLPLGRDLEQMNELQLSIGAYQKQLDLFAAAAKSVAA